MATGLVLLATLASPVLAAIAVVAVVHGRHPGLLVVPAAIGAIAVTGGGWIGDLAVTVLTALGCLTLGAAVVRLAPPRWLLAGVLSMAAVDVLLLAVGVGQPAAALLDDALRHAKHPTFHQAQLGPITKDYPDLVLAAVLGGMFAGRGFQRLAAVLVTILASTYGLLFAVADSLPATVPLAVVVVAAEWGPSLSRLARRALAARGRLVPLGGTGVLLMALLVGGCRSPAPGADASAAAVDRRPNVVVLMTDDQTVADLDVMPHVHQLLGAAGVTFDRSYVSYPLCCPSRATYLSGQYAHNHRVLGLYPPTGGYGRFDAREALPVWLARAGYHTAHIGKYMNGYGSQTPADPPPGWREWYGAVGYSTYRMWGYTLNENGVNRAYGSTLEEDGALYQTDVLARRAVDVIERRAAAKEPLFLSVAFLAPHHEGRSIRRFGGHLVRPAPRHAGRLAAKTLPLPPAFNEMDVSDKPSYIRRRPPLDGAQIDRITRHYHDRQESLLAVDEAVAEIVGALDRTGALQNTYVVFTSDNGYLQGEHRVPSGKLLPHDPSSRVPLIVRGPGLPAAATSRELVGNVDLAPTVLELAGATPGRVLDGRSLLPFARDPSLRSRRPLLHETSSQPGVNYKAVRTDRWLYVDYEGGERELYDLQADPSQLDSLHADPRYLKVRADLRNMLKNLQDCAGRECRTPVGA
jgi:arylsulfatase A-like enzyme